MTDTISNGLQRHLSLPGTFNVRDVGGYRTLDGHETRWQTLWRADSLHQLTADGQAALLAMGLKTVIDLRHDAEIKDAPDVFSASETVTYHNVPLFPAPSAATTKLPPPENLEQVYRGLLEMCQVPLKTVIDLLADSPGPTLVHCTAGKDRTGMVIALVLSAIRVEPETIVADYALTDEHMEPIRTELRRRQAETGLSLEIYERMLECRPELMSNTLRYLDERYGGVKNYLNKIGITDEQIGRLRHTLLVTVE